MLTRRVVAAVRGPATGLDTGSLAYVAQAALKYFYLVFKINIEIARWGLRPAAGCMGGDDLRRSSMHSNAAGGWQPHRRS